MTTTEPVPARGEAADQEVEAIRMLRLNDHRPPPGHEPTAGEGTVRPDQGPAGRAGARQASPGRAGPLPLPEGAAFPRQFAILLAEGLAGARPVRQLTPWLSKRGNVQLRRLLPLFNAGPLGTGSLSTGPLSATGPVSTGQPASTLQPASTGQPPGGGQRLRVVRVLTTRPAADAVEMTVIVATGHRTRALAVRLERGPGPASEEGRWLCTDIEAA